MIPPSGLKSELFPLRHKFQYGFGLNVLNGALGATIMTIVKGSKDSAMINPKLIEVNPHNANFLQETGSLCAQMSIIEKINISMHFTLTEDAITDGCKSMEVKYMPIFNSFPEKLLSTDDETGFTAASVLELLGDATNEDVTPLFTNNACPQGAGVSGTLHPMSTVNDTEVFGDMNLTTDTIMEPVTFDNDLFHNAIKFFTNKGAIRSMVGRQRTIYLTDTHPTKRVFIKKFVPRAVRRIVNQSYFGMLVFVPQDNDYEQAFYSGATTDAKPHIGIKMLTTYNEWHADHDQEMTA